MLSEIFLHVSQWTCTRVSKTFPSEFTLIYMPLEIHYQALRCLYFPSLCLDCGTNTKCFTLTMSIFSLKKSELILKPKSQPWAAWTGRGRSENVVLQHLCHFTPGGAPGLIRMVVSTVFSPPGFDSPRLCSAPEPSLLKLFAIRRTTKCFAIIMPPGIFSCPHQFCSLS